jgi:hypothetical protein
MPIFDFSYIKDDDEDEKTPSQKAREQLKETVEKKKTDGTIFDFSNIKDVEPKRQDPVVEQAPERNAFQKVGDFVSGKAKEVVASAKSFFGEQISKEKETASRFIGQDQSWTPAEVNDFATIPFLEKQKVDTLSRIESLSLKQDKSKIDEIRLKKLNSDYQNIDKLLSGTSEDRANAKGFINTMATLRATQNVAGGFIDTSAMFSKIVSWKQEVSGNQLQAAQARATSEKLAEWADAVRPENQELGDRMAEGFGSVLSFYIPGVGIQKLTGLASKVSPKIALFLGGKMSSTLESAAEAGDVYETLRAEDKSVEEANKAANNTFWANVALNIVLDKFGLFSDGKSLRVLSTATSEGIQEMSQAVISNVNTGRPYDEGMIESGLIGAVTGGTLGGLVSPGDIATIPNAEVKNKDVELVDSVLQKEMAGKVSEKAQEEAPELNILSSEAAQFENAKDFADSQGTIEERQIGAIPADTIVARDPVDQTTPEFKSLFTDIQENGIKEPVIVQVGKDGKIETTEGSHRVVIAQDLGVNVPVIVTQGKIEGLKTIKEFFESVKSKETSVFRGSRGEVEQTKRNFGRVLQVKTNQYELLQKLAKEGNKDAKAHIDSLPKGVKRVDFTIADPIIRRAYQGKYDTIQYDNQQMKQIGKEFYDLKSDQFFAEREETAKQYAAQNRGGKKTDTKAISDKAYKTIVKNGGVTISLAKGQPKKGFAYAPNKDTERVFDKETFSDQDISDFINDNMAELSKKGNYIGGWEDGGKIYLDISRIGAPSVKTLEEAQKASQLAVYDLSSGESIEIGKVEDKVYNILDEATNVFNQYRRKISEADRARSKESLEKVSRDVQKEKVTISDIESYVDSKGVKFRTDTSLEVKEDKLTSKFLEHSDIKGKESTSYSYLFNLSKSTSFPLKQAEREIVQRVLDTHFKNEKKVDMNDFRRLVIGEMMPLEAIPSSTYAGYGSDNVGLGSADTKTYILNSPFAHGEAGHFPSDFQVRLKPDEVEVREIPPQEQNPRAKFAVIQKGVELTRENIEQNVFTVAVTKQEAQKWIDEHTDEGYDGKFVKANKKVGLFSHFRTFDETEIVKDSPIVDGKMAEIKVAHIAEVQSDAFQNLERVDRNLPELVLVNDLKNSIKGYKGDILIAESLIKAFKKPGLEKQINSNVSFKESGVLGYELRNQLAEEFNVDKFELERYIEKYRGSDNKFDLKEAKSYLENMVEKVNKAIETGEAQLVEAEKALAKADTTQRDKFLDYKNIWHERSVREAINIKAKEGFDVVRFPTPRTVAMIEGFVSEDGESMPYEIVTAQDNEKLNFGDIIDYGGEEFTVIGVDEGGGITVAKSDGVNHFDSDQYMEEEIDGRWEEAQYEIESLEKDFGKIDTAEKAQEVIEQIDILNKLIQFNQKATDLESVKTMMANDGDIPILTRDVKNMSLSKINRDAQQESLDRINERYETQIKEIESRKKPSKEQISKIPKEVLEAHQNSRWNYNLDYGAETILEEMAESEGEVSIDDFEDGFKNREAENYDPDFEGIYANVFYEERRGGTEVWTTENSPETFMQPDQYEAASSIEDFDLNSFDGSQRTVLEFYRKQLLPYVKKIRKDAELITDENGNQWLESKITKDDLRAPTAFRLKDDLAKVGVKISNEQEQEILKLNSEIFGDTNVKIVGQIFANNKALGAYSDKLIQILDGQKAPTETFYHEAVHKYLDVFTDRSEYIEILKEAQKKYQLNDLAAVEERLAEDFIEYAAKRKTISGKIKAFFDKIISRINKYLGNKSAIDELYNNILSGKAKKKSNLPIKTTPESRAKSQFKPVTTPSGEKKPSRAYQRVSARIEESLRADLTYDSLNIAEETAKAISFVEKFPEIAVKVAKGIERAPTGYTETAISIAASEKALADGDIKLFSRLEAARSLRQTRRGQEIVMERGRVDENSTHHFVSEVLKARLDAVAKTNRLIFATTQLARRVSGGKFVSRSQEAVGIIDKKAKDLQRKVNKETLSKLESAQDILNRLTCKV